MKVMLRAWLYRLARDRKANVAVITAIMMVPLIFLLGMTLDFTQALRKKEQLDAAADAAAIAAVRPAMLMQTDAVAAATATAIFNSTAKSLTGLAAIPTPTITVTDVGLQRTVSVSYNAGSLNNFPKVLQNTASWPIGIGATNSDISTLITATRNQPSSSANCGFACHETHPNSDSGANSSTKDNLTIARANNVTLRIDLVANALNQLLISWSNCPQAGVTGGVMQCMSALNNTTYKRSTSV
jgi:Flp pilus assembly protein TadG